MKILTIILIIYFLLVIAMAEFWNYVFRFQTTSPKVYKLRAHYFVSCLAFPAVLFITIVFTFAVAYLSILESKKFDKILDENVR